jgi:hypothetical protein
MKCGVRVNGEVAEVGSRVPSPKDYLASMFAKWQAVISVTEAILARAPRALEGEVKGGSSPGYSSASRSLSSDSAKNRRFDLSDSAKPFK